MSCTLLIRHVVSLQGAFSSAVCLSLSVCVRLLRIHSTQLPSQLPFGFAGPHQSTSSAKNAIQAIFNLRCTHVAPLAQDARSYPARTVFTVTAKTPIVLRFLPPLTSYPWPWPVSLLYIKLKKQTCRAKNFYHSAGLLPIFFLLTPIPTAGVSFLVACCLTPAQCNPLS